MNDEFVEIKDSEFVSYIIGSSYYAITISDKNYEQCVDPLFAKMSEELIKDMNSLGIYHLFLRFMDCTNVRNWAKKFIFMLESKNKFYSEPIEDRFGYPEEGQIIAFFCGMIRWIPASKNIMHFKEEFLRCVWKNLCWGMEWEKVLDLWLFFESEDISNYWDDILIHKFDLRKQISYPDKPNEQNWDTSDEGLELYNFQKAMK